ncbi:MAG TPA: PEP-CTERM sorting domain-containing protein [Vicinamibacterales bacterium]|nr:PEP-CTERM sorting domain-containing protein [Vicinamibacterales bacterium]
MTCSPCTPGTSLNLSSNVTIGNWGAGAATIDGQSWGTVYYTGSLQFAAGSVIVPDVQPQPPGLDETVIVPAFSPFTFTGTLTGFADPSRTGAPLFSIQLAGGGSSPLGAVAGFGNLGSGTFLDYVDYSFNDVASTPEPGSLLLLGSGAAWIAARCRRRRRGKPRLSPAAYPRASMTR